MVVVVDPGGAVSAVFSLVKPVKHSGNHQPSENIDQPGEGDRWNRNWVVAGLRLRYAEFAATTVPGSELRKGRLPFGVPRSRHVLSGVAAECPPPRQFGVLVFCRLRNTPDSGARMNRNMLMLGVTDVTSAVFQNTSPVA